MATGTPTDAPMRQAMEWQVVLWSGEVTDDEYRAWQAWLARDPANADAWQRISRMSDSMARLPSGVARQTLQRPAVSRRQLLQLCLVGSGAVVLGHQASRTSLWQHMTADYRSPTGDQREVLLADGSRLLLNTASAVDAHIAQGVPDVRIFAGSELIASPARGNMRLHTQHGSIFTAPGQIQIRDHGDYSMVAVHAGQAELLAAGGSDRLMLEAGSLARLSGRQALRAGQATPALMAWRNGLMLAERMPLRGFLSELARYRTGQIICDDAVAGLLVSGVFPVRDTDHALESLAGALPVRLGYTTRFRVRVSAA